MLWEDGTLKLAVDNKKMQVDGNVMMGSVPVALIWVGVAAARSSKIMREESADAPEDTILEEFRKGYKMGENTLIRPAMVKVAAAPSE